MYKTYLISTFLSESAWKGLHIQMSYTKGAQHDILLTFHLKGKEEGFWTSQPKVINLSLSIF